MIDVCVFLTKGLMFVTEMIPETYKMWESA